jgi:hypothetical protein
MRTGLIEAFFETSLSKATGNGVFDRLLIHRLCTTKQTNTQTKLGHSIKFAKSCVVQRVNGRTFMM